MTSRAHDEARTEDIAVVVVESMWGNTRAVAAAVADGLSEHLPAHVVGVSEAPLALSGPTRLLVVGGPTHAFSMSRTTTRHDAVTRGADAAGATEVGLREWLDDIARLPASVQVAAFDTKVRKPRLPGSAAHAAARRLRKKGGRVSLPPETFYVLDYEGPLAPGELDRARAWGARLGATLPDSASAAERR
jgi:hypothetical protein